jgi:hypothetical protein
VFAPDMPTYQIDLANVLDIPTVLNEDTCQQMVFCPATGDVQVWRRV